MFLTVDYKKDQNLARPYSHLPTMPRPSPLATLDPHQPWPSTLATLLVFSLLGRLPPRRSCHPQICSDDDLRLFWCWLLVMMVLVCWDQSVQIKLILIFIRNFRWCRCLLYGRAGLMIWFELHFSWYICKDKDCWNVDRSSFYCYLWPEPMKSYFLHPMFNNQIENLFISLLTYIFSVSVYILISKKLIQRRSWSILRSQIYPSFKCKGYRVLICYAFFLVFVIEVEALYELFKKQLDI